MNKLLTESQWDEIQYIRDQMQSEIMQLSSQYSNIIARFVDSLFIDSPALSKEEKKNYEEFLTLKNIIKAKYQLLVDKIRNEGV
jgi:hypothetical protein